jgi:hypothetical protein
MIYVQEGLVLHNFAFFKEKNLTRFSVEHDLAYAIRCHWKQTENDAAVML